MKLLSSTLLSLVLAIAFFSCSKSIDAPAEDWSQKLKNTAWSGEYAYISGIYTKRQPFSIVLAEDGTLTWSDVGSTRPGGTWKCIADKVTVTFPNGTAFEATVSSVGWSKFVVPDATGITIAYISSSSVLKASNLINTTWDAFFNGSKATIRFVDGQKLELTYPGTAARLLDYTIESSGIRFQFLDLIYSHSCYGAFESNGTVLNGLDRYVNGFPPPTTTFYSWSAKKI